jgi:hypothetical protein
MGAGASSRAAQLSITDPKVCRSFLVGTCPHDLFTNTKQDLGPCPKVHSEPLKSEYEATKDTAKYGFEYDYMRDLQKYIDECNRRIDAAQRRLEKTPDEIRQTNALVSSHSLQSIALFVHMGDRADQIKSSNKSPTSPNPSKPASSKSKSSAAPQKYRAPTKNSSASSKPCKPKARKSANSKPSPTPPVLRAIRNYRSVMCAVRICQGWITIGGWRITFMGRCTWGMRR